MTTQIIKNRITNKIIYKCNAKTLKEAVEKAVKEMIDLSYTNLSYADLSHTDLSTAYLNNTKFSNSIKYAILK